MSKSGEASALDEFYAAQLFNGARCAVNAALDKMNPEHRGKFLAALETRGIQSTAIVRVLKSWGVPIGESSINRHRRGVCACER